MEQPPASQPNLAPAELGLIVKALSFAAHKHRDQRRNNADASPYINHPIALADVLTNEADIRDGAIICAALLHDTIEDTDTSFAELERHFGAVIAGFVLEMTDDKTLPKAVRKQRQIDRADRLSDSAALVKLADKICNLRDLAEQAPVGWDTNRRREYFDWARQVVDRLPATGVWRDAMTRLKAAFARAYAQRPT